MWASHIVPDQIRLPANLGAMEVILGVNHERVLTHKGIDFECLTYNSIELQELCRRFGHGIEAKIRVNEDDLGHVYVIHPQTPNPIRVPAIRFDYANGISLWQHKVIRQYQLKAGHFLDNPDGWLDAKEEIASIIAKELRLKRKTSHKRIARFQQQNAAALRCPETIAAPQDSTTRRLISISADAAVSTAGLDKPEEDINPHLAPLPVLPQEAIMGKCRLNGDFVANLHGTNLFKAGSARFGWMVAGRQTSSWPDC
jgi:putative transposase